MLSLLWKKGNRSKHTKTPLGKGSPCLQHTHTLTLVCTCLDVFRPYTELKQRHLLRLLITSSKKDTPSEPSSQLLESNVHVARIPRKSIGWVLYISGKHVSTSNFKPTRKTADHNQNNQIYTSIKPIEYPTVQLPFTCQHLLNGCCCGILHWPRVVFAANEFSFWSVHMIMF